MKFMIFIFMTVFSYLGWWAGEWMGFEIMGCFLISSAVSAVGIVLGWKLANWAGLE